MEYSFHKDELETILIYNRADDCWVVSTNIPHHWNRFEKQGWTKTNDNGYERSYKAPKNAVTFRNLNRIKRELTEEQKQANAERLRNLRVIGRKTT